MRVIAGEFKSRVLKDPRGNRTHPMSEKIRGALFNAIGDINDLTFLDAFAGTGSVAIEALSRGATGVHAVELSPDAFETLKLNRDSVTDSSRLQIHRANVKTWLKNTNKTFDIIVADPPYDAISMKVLDTVTEHVKKDGLLVVSLPTAEHYKSKNLQLIGEKHYGNAKLAFYKNVV